MEDVSMNIEHQRGPACMINNRRTASQHSILKAYPKHHHLLYDMILEISHNVA